MPAADKSKKQGQRVLVVAGARPNFVKIAPLVEQLATARARGVETLLVHTGQHYDETMSRLFFDQMGIPRPDVNLEVGSGSHGQQTGEVLGRIEPVMQEWKPDMVVVVGDVNSTLAAALAAAKLHIPVAHVEAGLRSFDRTMPEETNRVLTDALAEYLFVSEPSGVENLRREGAAEGKIHLVGNVMIDSLRKFRVLAKNSSVLRDLRMLDNAGATRRFALLTLHRPSNVDDAATLRPLLECLNEIAREIAILFPAHPRTQERIERFGLGGLVRTEWEQAERGVLLCPPVGYLEFLRLESEAAFVLTDSGGIQEETTVLGVPCLTLRENTERPITVAEGTNTLVGSEPQRILAAAREILAGRGKKGRTPELWDGNAAKRIVKVLVG
jgi:UDP-N-acetylglucosamine 2-epimerase (non-hydrolysing)